MNLNLKKILKEQLDAKTLLPQQVFYRVLPHFILEIMTRYFRLSVIGKNKMPKKGRALIIANHSGYAGFDAVMLAHHIQKHTGRMPRVLTHALWFISKTTSIPMKKMGFIKATRQNGVRHLNKDKYVLIFPEGEHGNFKPTAKAYHLQKFKKGFVRMALETNSPIVPALIIGAEETHINLAQLKLTKFLKGTVIPVPLNVIPLPARWKIIFLDPIKLPYGPEKLDDEEYITEVSRSIRLKLQKRLHKEIKKRPAIYMA